MQGDLVEKVARAICLKQKPNKAAMWEATAAINAMCDAIPGLRDRMLGWQPIETAKPRKGVRLLGVVDGDVRVIMWTKTSHVPLYGWCLVDQGAEDADLCKPTHWMPLPAPPASPYAPAKENGDG